MHLHFFGRGTWLGIAALLVAGMVGCAEDAGEEARDASGSTDADTDRRLDMAVEPDDGRNADARLGADAADLGPRLDANGGADADPAADARTPREDSAVDGPIDDCVSACAKYEECGRLADVFGDEATCLARCERFTRDRVPEGWYRCLDAEACNLLQLCRVPSAQPLACEEVCDLTRECGIDVDRAGCVATCEANADPFRACGEHLVGGCRTDALLECVARDVFSACSTQCTTGVACNVIREADCLPGCVTRAMAGDRLAQVRDQSRGRCVTLAGEDCLRINECFNPPPLGPNDAPRACGQLCEAQDLCGLLEEDRPRCIQTCLDVQTGQADPDTTKRRSAGLLCGQEQTCGAVEACLQRGSPEAQCADHCAALDACGLAPADCAAACDAVWPRLRAEAYRACVEEAGDDCAAVAACHVAPQVPCDRYCDRLTDCGLGAVRCRETCDDEHFQNPTTVALRVACGLGARECNGPANEFNVAACRQNPEVGGRACANYCRATRECVAGEGPDAVGSCLSTCVSGLGDAEGLAMDAAADCLGRQAINALCPVLVGCLPPAPPAVDCAAHCGRLDACLIPGDCAADCAVAPDRDEAGCAVDALRVGAGCEGVSECVGFSPDPPDADCTALCERRYQCDRDDDPYLCRLECTPTPPEVPIQLACAEVSACGPDLNDCLALPSELSPDCAEPCALATGCGGFGAEEDCAALCTGRGAAPRARPDYLERARACVERAAEDGDCRDDAVDQCFRPSACDLIDDVVLVPPGGGRFPTDTTGREGRYEASCAGGQTGGEVVFMIVLGQRTRLRAETVDANYDTALALRANDCDDANAEIDCDDDSAGDLMSLITIDLQPGTYFLFVSGFLNRVGTATLQLDLTPI